MGVPDRIDPVADRCVAGGRLGRTEIGISRTASRAIVVRTVFAGEVVGIVALLFDVPHHVAAGVDHLHQVGDLAVDRPGRALVTVLVVLWRKRRDLVGGQVLAIRRDGLGGEISIGLEILVVLLEQDVPVLVDLQQRRDAESGIVDRVGVRSDEGAVGGHCALRGRRARIRLERRGGRVADEGIRARHIRDVAAAMVVEYGGPHGERVGDERNIDRGVDVRIRIAPGRDAVAGVDIAFRDVELGLVRDVANGAGLGSAAEQRSLGTLQHLDALHVHHVHIVVACRELHGLVVQVQGDVRERRGGRLRLIARTAGAQAAHEDVAGAGTVAAEGHVGRVLQKVVEGLHVELLQLIARDRLNGDGHVLNRFRPALRRHRDLLDALGIARVSPRGGMRCAHSQAGTAQDCRNSVRQLRICVHCLGSLLLFGIISIERDTAISRAAE